MERIVVDILSVMNALIENVKIEIIDTALQNPVHQNMGAARSVSDAIFARQQFPSRSEPHSDKTLFHVPTRYVVQLSIQYIRTRS